MALRSWGHVDRAARPQLDELPAARRVFRSRPGRQHQPSGPLRFLDWDRALRRLDELNNRVEDPKLWDDPKAAPEVMRERRRLDEAISATRAIENEVRDTLELMEMAEAEGDSGMVDEGVATLAALAGYQGDPVRRRAAFFL